MAEPKVVSIGRTLTGAVLRAAITDGTTIKRLLAHLGLPTEPLPVALAREPPQLEFPW